MRYKKCLESLSAFCDFSRDEQDDFLKERFLTLCAECLSLNVSLVIVSISKTSEDSLKYLQDYHYLPLLSFQFTAPMFILPLLIFLGL